MAALILAAIALRSGWGGWLALAPLGVGVALVEIHVAAMILGWRFPLDSWTAYRASWATPASVRRVVRQWDHAVVSAGLLGQGRRAVPVSLAVRVPRGVVLHVVTPQHSALDRQLHDAAPELTRAFGCPVEVGNAEGSTTVTVVHFDPNAVARRPHTHSTEQSHASAPAPMPSRMIRLGRDGTGADQEWNLTDLVHIAIQGITRAGKSSALYVILTALAKRRDTIITGVDPTGVLLGPLSHTPGSTHDALPGVFPSQFLTGTDVTGETTARWLEAACAAMDARISQLMRTRADKFTPDNPDAPVLLVVIDELPAVLARSQGQDRVDGSRSRTHARIIAALGRLLREGAKANIQVMVTAQRFDASLLGGDVRANFTTRISFRVDNADAVRMLHPDADETVIRAVTSLPPGRAFIETSGHPRTFTQIDYMTYEEYRDAIATAPHPTT
ncbi:hypothetical protein ON058_00030 [Demequina sp. B12]|uniref:hypothetical protein n=1 Tax=Demequina sp. B12 TaxID=2992757 RepID=UPI00237BC2EF|nr:hypothetical protein [Demequina sp. B12]MDE0571802.1 hypothetical protein [Demequina sp. B12]